MVMQDSKHPLKELTDNEREKEKTLSQFTPMASFEPLPPAFLGEGATIEICTRPISENEI